MRPRAAGKRDASPCSPRLGRPMARIGAPPHRGFGRLYGRIRVEPARTDDMRDARSRRAARCPWACATRLRAAPAPRPQPARSPPPPPVARHSPAAERAERAAPRAPVRQHRAPHRRRLRRRVSSRSRITHRNIRYVAVKPLLRLICQA
ncbi:hypothetical protein DP49_5535 [Burkholderia pseudomallei]|nr:hypothetical protein DP49_5535 [Burkholderia pseudomallei]